MKRKLQYSNINQNMKCDNKVIKVSNPGPGTWEYWTWDQPKIILHFAKTLTLT